MKKSVIIVIVLAVIVVVGIVLFLMFGSGQPSGNSAASLPSSPSTSTAATATPMMPTMLPAPTTTPPAPTSNQTAASHVSVSIANFAFDPSSLSVKVGATVTWTNNDVAPHTVTSDAGSFASQTLSPGQSFSHTFTTAGTFAYHCAIHPYMHGTVVVTQ